jgi:hypothetical protein
LGQPGRRHRAMMGRRKALDNGGCVPKVLNRARPPGSRPACAIGLLAIVTVSRSRLTRSKVYRFSTADFTLGRVVHSVL